MFKFKIVKVKFQYLLFFRVIQYTFDIVAGGRHNVSKINSWGIANGAGLSISKSK